MIISAKIIRKPRANRVCAVHGNIIPPHNPHIRLFGFSKGKPFVDYLCWECADEQDDPKIKKLLREG